MSFVINRRGEREPVLFDKITKRLKVLCAKKPELNHIDTVMVTQKIAAGLCVGLKTSQIDDHAAETAAFLVQDHPEYGQLASRIAVSNLHKKLPELDFLITWKEMYSYVHPKTEEHSPLITLELVNILQTHREQIYYAIDYERDFMYDYFGFKTLEHSYLIKMNDVIKERPQQMLMRVAIGIHGWDIENVLKCYHMFSLGIYTHATPTLFNAGTPIPQLSSCFLSTMSEDSIHGIFATLKQSAIISKGAGGYGLSVTPIRAAKSYIAGTRGVSNGIVPMIRVFNATARYVDQGGGKRKGAYVIFIEPWHADIFQFLDLRKNTGKEESRARDLFYGLWIPDLFMRRVEKDENWSLFCPNETKKHGFLYDVWGDEFDKLYELYEREGKARKVVKARYLWEAIVDSQIETGTPYMMYKDACNRKSNQQNLGTIRGSNLCTEIVEYTSPKEIAVCNLASVAFPKFVCNSEINGRPKYFDFRKLYDATYQATISLNRVIDVNYYDADLPETKESNLKNRPMAIGCQGLADTFILLRFPFTSEDAKDLNKKIFETMYFAALSASNDLAKLDGKYASYEGSPISKGLLQFDLWRNEGREVELLTKDMWDWEGLRKKISQYGVRNSLLIGPMPTATTSHILGNNECFEPFTTNIYTRRILAGEFVVVNKYLIQDLDNLGLWNDEMKNEIIHYRGSVQHIDRIPKSLKELYKTAWELPQKDLIDMAIDRAPFICQSQSLNIFMEIATRGKMTSMHFYGWKKGAKTGMYYLRTKPAADAIQFTLPVTVQNIPKEELVRGVDELDQIALFMRRKEKVKYKKILGKELTDTELDEIHEKERLELTTISEEDFKSVETCNPDYENSNGISESKARFLEVEEKAEIHNYREKVMEAKLNKMLIANPKEITERASIFGVQFDSKNLDTCDPNCDSCGS